MTIPDLISSKYHCPRCQSPKVYEVISTIYCPKCKLTFDVKMLALFEDKDVLANEELEGMSRVLEGDDDDEDEASLMKKEFL